MAKTITNKCRQCGEVYQARIDGKRMYCSMKCKNESMVGKSKKDHVAWKERVITECANCGSGIEILPSKVKNGRGKFCSRQCFFDFIKGNISLSKTGGAVKKREEKECVVCSSSFYVKANRVKYCSKECAIQDQLTRSPLDHPSYKGEHIYTKCIVCSKDIILFPSQENGHRGKFCSTKCHGRWMASQPKEDHPRWRGGISFDPYPASFDKKLKSKIRKRDNNRCSICGKPAKIVHHIDYNKKNSSPNNLTVVCKKCHGKTNSNRNNWMAILSDMILSKHNYGFFIL